ncbi:MAG: YqgE/AlgH family protein [Litorilituus sp.]|jgi:putative transcriptional regulator|nr:YqgE/AlgH family protein [Litorilituus sp.]
MQSLENQFLIAMPSMGDPFFNKTVTYICEHNDEGAMGLIINLPVNICLNDLLKQIDDEADSEAQVGIVDDNHLDKQQKENSSLLASLEQPVLSGGPISQNRGFVLHSTQQGWKSSLALSKDIMITTSKDILLALGTKNAPEKFMVTLGYAGWGPGQLEEELKENSWLTIEANSDIIFKTPIEQRWQKATEMFGIDVAHLSSDVGHA